MNLLKTKSLRTTALISTALIVASQALNGSAAMAANLRVHKAVATTRISHPRAATHVVARRRAPPAQFGFDVGGFIQAMLGGPLPPRYAQIVRNAVRASASHRYANSSDSYDHTPSPTYTPIDNSASDAAAAQAASANAAMIQSMQAAQEQNDEANAEVNAGLAAALQTEINAGM